MKRKKLLVAWLSIVSILLCIYTVTREEKADLQKGISDEILRFHVIANSDTPEDQNLKMRVKEVIVEQMKELLRDCTDVKETTKKIEECMGELQKTAEKTVKEEGYGYPVHTELSQCYFPAKTYGDCLFPAGTYQAFRIRIGRAKGHNWWCVLYPKLCFIDAVHAVVPQEEKEELQEILTEEEYASLFDWKKTKVKITSKWLFRP